MRRLLAVCLVFAATAAQAESTGFVRGYAQAILDRQFPDLSLTARSGPQTGAVIVSGAVCPSGAQRQAVQAALTGTGPVTTMRWSQVCRSTGTATVAANQKPHITLLPESPIFQPIQADPRKPQLSLALQAYHTRGKRFVIGAVNAGATFGLIEGPCHGGTWQVGIQGGAFSIFNQNKPSNDLLDTDYLVGLPVTYRHGRWSVRGRIYHMSSHLGDEFILNNDVRTRTNLSYEAVDTIVSRDLWQLRLYGGGGYLVRTTLGLDRGIVQGGAEWRQPDVIGDLDLALGVNLKSYAYQNWTVNQSYEATLILQRDHRQVRFSLQYFDGKSPNGQFFLNHLDYYGFGVQFGI